MQFLDHTVDALFVTNPTNIRYLTEFEGSKNSRDAYLLVTADKWFLITSLLYQEEARIVAKKIPHVNAIFIKPDTNLAKIISDLNSQIPLSKLGIEADSLTVSELKMLETTLPATRTVDHSKQIEKIRAKKNPQEVAEIKRACQITMDCFEYIKTRVVPGVTETYLAWEIEKFIRDEGATMAFEPIVAFDAHTAVPHHRPTITHLTRKNGAILFDFGAQVTGYCADITRMMTVGTPAKEWTSAHEVVQKAYKEVVKYLESVPNPIPKTADKIAKTVIQEFELPEYMHALGHGVGLDVHELPMLNHLSEEPLEEGEVFTIEPAVYIPGKFGIRLEDTFLKTKTGIECLTRIE